MTELKEGASAPSERNQRSLRDAVREGTEFARVAELVPWRGSLGDDAGDRARALASELGADGRFAALSITDSAGGHAMLSLEVLASQLTEAGQKRTV
jgi:hypothetical protein